MAKDRHGTSVPRSGAAGRAVSVVHRFGVWRDGLPGGVPRQALRAPYVLLHRRVRNRYRIELHYTTDVGSGVRFSDHGDIVVGSRVVIGDDCDIGHGVTLGKPRDDSVGWPVIGDRVTIGPGAAIIGAIRVGDDAVVGPNAVVLVDVPAGAYVTARSAVAAPQYPALRGAGDLATTPRGPRERPAVRAGVRLGAGCTVGYGVTLGWSLPSSGSPPETVIGDGAIIGDGAVVLAGVSVGAGATIGANAVVDADVPALTAVVAPPPGILRPLRTET
jgi:serine O-acetyltransferase